jgi:hypothetical protein
MTERPFGTINVVQMNIAPDFGVICIDSRGQHLGTVAEGTPVLQGTATVVVHPEVLERLKRTEERG